MHIIGISCALMVGAFLWYRRIKIMREAAPQVVDVGQTLAKFPRKMRFQNATRNADVSQIDDVRFCVTTLLFLLVSQDGRVDQNAEALIAYELQKQFEPTSADMEELQVFARWAVGAFGAPKKSARGLVIQIHKLAPNAGRELSEMISAIEVKCHPRLYNYVYKAVQAQFGLDEKT